MSDVREVKIKIEYEEKASSDTGTKVVDDSEKAKETKKDKDNLKKSVVLHEGLKVTASLLKQSVDNTHNRYFSMKENYMAENIYNITTSTINKAVSIGASIIGGYTIGHIPGAVIAGVGAVVGEVLSVQSMYSKYYSTLNASNMNVDFARTRAGLIDNNRGTEN